MFERALGDGRCGDHLRLPFEAREQAGHGIISLRRERVSGLVEPGHSERQHIHRIEAEIEAGEPHEALHAEPCRHQQHERSRHL